jgi:hypothetical protein
MDNYTFFPLFRDSYTSGVPINYHPGAFGFKRRVNYHTGVDLYCSDGDCVNAIEDGIVVGKGIFTGPEVGSAWWEKTHYLMIQGSSGVFNYGEVYPPLLEIGDEVEGGTQILHVKRVLFEDKKRSDIPFHSCSMLHLELYKHGASEPVDWRDYAKPECLLDPTAHLLSAYLLDNKAYNTKSIISLMNQNRWDNSDGRTVG